MPVSESSLGKSLVLGVTGASGVIFARRMLQLLEADQRVGKIHLIISGSALKVMRDELKLDVVAIATLGDLLQYLRSTSDPALTQHTARVAAYRDRYGV